MGGPAVIISGSVAGAPAATPPVSQGGSEAGASAATPPVSQGGSIDSFSIRQGCPEEMEVDMSFGSPIFGKPVSRMSIPITQEGLESNPNFVGNHDAPMSEPQSPIYAPHSDAGWLGDMAAAQEAADMALSSVLRLANMFGRSPRASLEVVPNQLSPRASREVVPNPSPQQSLGLINTSETALVSEGYYVPDNMTEMVGLRRDRSTEVPLHCFVICFVVLLSSIMPCLNVYHKSLDMYDS